VIISYVITAAGGGVSMYFNDVIWYDISEYPTTTIITSPTNSFPNRDPLYTMYNMDNKGVRIGLPGVSRGEVALKEKDGFLEVFVTDKLVYQLKIPERISEVKCSMKEGLLIINWVTPRDVPVKITF